MGSFHLLPHRLDSPPLTREESVLLACAHHELTAEHVENIAREADRLDWTALWELALAHGIAPFVGRHLRALARTAPPSLLLPESFDCRLRKDLWHAKVQALTLLRHQQALADAGERAGLRLLWLKGLALSEQLYGEPEARLSGDLDVLVGPAEFAAAQDCLRRLGGSPLNDDDADHPLAIHHEVWRADAAQPWPLVEMHRRLSGAAACQPDVAGLLARARQLPLAGQPVWVPAHADELLLLCMHGHHHNFAVLRCLMDVAEYVQRFHAAIDWPGLLHAARRFRVLGRVSAALRLADAILGLGQAADVLRQFPLSPWQRWALRGLGPRRLLQVGGHEDDACRLRLSLLMDRWSDVARLLGPHLRRRDAPAPWRYVPGGAHVHHVLQVLTRVVREKLRAPP